MLHRIQPILILAILACCTSIVQAQTYCAQVKIQIEQELTLERQAFDAHMRINNGLENLSVENVNVEVLFTDKNDQPVVATTDPNNSSATFFIRIDTMNNINDVNGNGSVAPGTSADIHWLIIPAPGAAGSNPQGELYYVGARLTYTLGGEEKEVVVTPDFIYVKPMPNLVLDYFLPIEVYSDDPFTPEIEPPVPFNLGVRISNTGYGTAKNVKIESSQPKIIENELDLLIGFEITGSTVNDEPVAPSLLADFGDIPPSDASTGRWEMISTLSGEFIDFSATFTHADELGGNLTSLIEEVNTHLILHDVIADLPGRDAVRDFLAQDGNYINLYESDGEDTEVTDLSASATLSGGGSQYSLDIPTASGFIFVTLPDPKYGQRPIAEVVRDDGKILKETNRWIGQRWDKGNDRWAYSLNIFDANPLEHNYTIRYQGEGDISGAPLIAYINDKTVQVGQQLGFIVRTSDPDGTIPVLATGPLPFGASFDPSFEPGIGRFEWIPQAGQEGNYRIEFFASDESETTSRSMIITVTGEPVVNQPPQAFATAVSGNEDQVITAYLNGDDANSDPLTYRFIELPQNGSLTMVDATTGQFTYTPNPNFYGSDSFTYQVNDTQVDAPADGNVSINITAINDAPSSAVATITTLAGQASQAVAAIIVDADPDDVHTLSILTQPSNGVASLVNNQLVYTPNEGFSGSDSFSFRATDLEGTYVDGTASVTVESDPFDLSITSVSNEYLAEREIRTVTSIHLTGNEGRDAQLTLIFHSGGDALPMDIITVTLQPGDNPLSIDNHLPVEANDYGVVEVMVDSNDALAETDETNNSRTNLSLGGVTDAPYQLAILGMIPEFLCHTGDAFFSGRIHYREFSDSGAHNTAMTGRPFTYRINDSLSGELLIEGNGLTNHRGAFFIQETIPSDANQRQTLTISAADGDFSVELQHTMSVVDCDGAVAGTVIQPEDQYYPGPNGSLSIVQIDGNPSWTVFPNLPIVSAGDGNLGGLQGTGSNDSVHPDGPNLGETGGVATPSELDLRIAQLSAEPFEPTVGQSITLTAKLEGNDSIYGLPVSFFYEDDVFGDVPLSELTWVYHNDKGFLRTTFTPTQAGTLRLSAKFAPSFFDSDPNNDVAILDLNVLPDNAAPVAADLSFTLAEDTPFSDNLSASDADGDALTYVIVTPPASGTLTLVDPTGGAFSFIPAENAFGDVSFTYTANDGQTDGNTATVTLTVEGVNDLPVASDQSLVTDEDTAISATLAATDVENDSLSYAIATAPTLGAVVLDDASSGAFTYTPNPDANGSDSFTFFANDGSGDGQPATVTIEITPVNDAPLAIAASFTTDENLAFSGSLQAEDIDGDSLSFAILANPALGTLVLDDATTGAFTYTPNNLENGSDGFTFTVSDGTLTSEPATVNITINAINSAPVVSNLSLDTDEDTSIAGTLSASDEDGDALTYSLLSQPAFGSLERNGTAFTYTPAENANGTDSFTYTANDGQVDGNTATVTINVAAVNDAPIAVASAFASDEDTVYTGTLTASDVDGDTLTFAIIEAPSLGNLSLDNPTSGAFTYTPNPDANGDDSFRFSASDGSLDSNALIEITINPINDAPIYAGTFTSQQALQGEPFAYSLPADSFSDVDGDALSLSASLQDGTPLPAWLSFDGIQLQGTAYDLESLIIRITANDGNLDVYGDFQLDVVPPAPVSISGFAFSDLSDNGIQDEGEDGIFARRFYLDLNRNGSRDSDEPTYLTNATGSFSFTDLAPGSYTLRRIARPGWRQTFAPENLLDVPQTIHQDSGSNGIVAGDFNSDGLQDVAITVSGGIQILSQGLRHSFADEVITLAGNPSNPIAYDFDNDGRLDLAVSLTGLDQIAMLHNGIDGWSTATIDIANTHLALMSNGDLLVGDRLANTLVTLTLDQGSYVPGRSYDLQDTQLETIHSTDLDGDLVPDVIVSDALSDNLRIYTNASTSGTLTSAGLSAASAIISGQFTQDNHQDLILASSGTLALLPGLGDGGFGDAELIGLDGDPVSLAAINLASGPDLDLAVSTLDGTLHLFENQSGTISLVHQIELGTGGIHLLASDSDRDGDADLIAAHNGEALPVQILANNQYITSHLAPGETRDDIVIALHRDRVIFAPGHFGDGADSNPGDGFALDSNGQSTLRAAIMEANALLGPDTIMLEAGTYSLSLIPGKTEADGDLQIDDQLTIIGAGTQATFIDAAAIDRVMRVMSSGDLILRDLSLIGGDAELGGALLNDGRVQLIDVQLADNIALDGGAIFNRGILTAERVTINGNHADNGGALYNETGASAELLNTTLSGNNAQFGGAIYSNGDLALIYTTISANSAESQGGILSQGVSQIVGSIVAGNNASFSDPDLGGGFTSLGYNLIGILGDATGFSNGLNGDQLGVMESPLDPQLLDLAHNGGQTPTHLPAAGSPAIDAAQSEGFPASDQRGLSRPIDGDADGFAVADSGAVELASPGYSWINPIGGETLLIGQELDLQWHSENVDGNVRIQLSRDSGLTWEELFYNIEDDHSQHWKVRGPATDGFRFQIFNIADQSILTQTGDIQIPEPSMQLTAPNGGQSALVGSTLDITWNGQNFDGDVRIELSRDNGETWNYLFWSTPNDGTQSWRVTGPGTDTALIRVKAARDETILDQSDATFSIPQPSFAITAPTGGHYLLDQEIDIQWTSSDIESDVRIQLSRDGGETWEYLLYQTANDGQETWKVRGEASETAVIRVVAQVDEQLYADSQPLAIVAPSITLISPHGGSYLLGDSLDIQWSTADYQGDARIELSRDNGATWEALYWTTDNDGQQDWTVKGAPSNEALIRVSHPSHPQYFAQSDQPFVIPVPALAITAPIGGETALLGSSLDITWDANNFSGPVRIQLSRDNGANWEYLFYTSDNDGSETWTVKGAATSEALIRIHAATDATVQTTSPATFTIPSPSLNLTAPNGGESLEIGTETTITWESSNFAGDVRIELSRDNGTTWEWLYYQTENDGEQTWKATSPATETALIRIKAATDDTVSDQSDASFRIPGSGMTVTAPVGGETANVGSQLPIRWEANGFSGDVRIEISRDGGATWSYAFWSTPNDGEELWNVRGEATDQALIRVSAAIDNSIVAQSNGTFTIPQPSIQLTSPNGGESFILGSQQEVTWTSTNFDGDVQVEYSPDGGTTWSFLWWRTENDGSQTWTVNGNPTSQGLFRIKAHVDNTVIDQSDAPFTIPTPSITVTSPNGGETLTLASQTEITWNSANFLGPVRIELSRDGGTTWEWIRYTTDNDGTENWTVTAPATTQALVRVSSAQNAAIQDSSDTNLSLQP